MIVNLGNWAAHAATLGWLVFTLVYGCLAPWWRSPIGRNVLVHGAVLAVTFGLVSAQLAFGVAWQARGWVRLIIFGSVAAVGWWRLAILLRDHMIRPTRPRRSTQVTGQECRECGR